VGAEGDSTVSPAHSGETLPALSRNRPVQSRSHAAVGSGFRPLNMSHRKPFGDTAQAMLRDGITNDRDVRTGSLGVPTVTEGAGALGTDTGTGVRLGLEGAGSRAVEPAQDGRSVTQGIKGTRIAMVRNRMLSSTEMLELIPE
jgi:hypothetical protein